DGSPEKGTAFRDGMAVHGRYRKPCPDCGSPVQRIVYAENETNYCARCQTGGVLLADRSLSRLLKDDWPRSLEEMEGGRRACRSAEGHPAAGGARSDAADRRAAAAAGPEAVEEARGGRGGHGGEAA